MSRQVDVNNPDSWDDADRAYLRDRPEMVPEQHRAGLIEPRATMAPTLVAESSEIARLRTFLETNYPNEMASVEQGDTPVGVAIRLLSGDETTDPDELTAETADDYDTWNVADLRGEIDTRRNENPDANLPADVSKMRKADAIGVLRNYDARYPA